MAELDMDEVMDGDMGDSSELSKLKEKVRALERQNALLKQTKTTDDGAKCLDDNIEDIQLLDMDELTNGDDNWLLNVGEENLDQDDDDDCAWLRQDMMSPNSLKKKSLVNKLDDIAKRKYFHACIIRSFSKFKFTRSMRCKKVQLLIRLISYSRFKLIKLFLIRHQS